MLSIVIIFLVFGGKAATFSDLSTYAQDAGMDSESVGTASRRKRALPKVRRERPSDGAEKAHGQERVPHHPYVGHDAGDVTQDYCSNIKIREVRTGSLTDLQPRGSSDKPIRLIHLIEYGNLHELPELYLVFLESLPYVDEMHVIEVDRDFKNIMKPRTWETHAVPALESFLARKGLDPKALGGKVVYHPIDLSTRAKEYELQFEPIRAVRRKLESSEACWKSTCLLVEGDLDEVISAEVLKVLRACEGAKPTADPNSNEVNAAVAMPFLRYNFAFSGNMFLQQNRTKNSYRWPAWGLPAVVHAIGRTRGNAGTEGNISALLEAAEQPRFNHGEDQGTYLPRALFKEDFVSKAKMSSRYVYDSDYELVHVDGRPLGWHAAWMLDGAAGLTEKVLYGTIEDYSHIFKNLARVYNTTEVYSEMVSYFDKVLQDPGSNADGQTVPSRLRIQDLPSAMLMDPDEFRPLMGEDIYRQVMCDKSRSMRVSQDWMNRWAKSLWRWTSCHS